MPTEFVAQVYAIARRIPRGRVVSYQQLAHLCGHPRGARIVGFMLRGCKDDAVPCHRVIHADGTLCRDEDFGPLQRQLLLEEGVGFRTDGRVDLAAYRWDGIS